MVTAEPVSTSILSGLPEMKPSTMTASVARLPSGFGEWILLRSADGGSAPPALLSLKEAGSVEAFVGLSQPRVQGSHA